MIANKDVLVHHPHMPSFDAARGSHGARKTSDFAGSEANLLGSRRLPVPPSPSTGGTPPTLFNLLHQPPAPSAAYHNPALAEEAYESLNLPADRYDLEPGSGGSEDEADAGRRRRRRSGGRPERTPCSVRELKAALRTGSPAHTDATSLGGSAHSSAKRQRRKASRSRRGQRSPANQSVASLGRRSHANPSFQDSDTSSSADEGPPPPSRHHRLPGPEDSSSEEERLPPLGTDHLDLSHHRPSRFPPTASAFMPRAEETETESEAYGVPNSLAPFRSPRFTFPHFEILTEAKA